MKQLVCLTICSMILIACSASAPLNLLSAVGTDNEVRTIGYGSDTRQKLDLYTPATSVADSPIVLFVYGGSWQSGDRSDYRFVGDALAKAGITAAIADYRVYPKVSFPGFVEDAAMAFAALRRQTGTSRPIFVMGHSAGAQIAALLAFDPKYLAREGLDKCRDVAGLIGLAGPYDFLPLPYPSLAPIFPEETRQQSQPIAFADGRNPPSLLLHGSADTVVEPIDTSILAEKLVTAGNRTTAILYEGVTHAEILGALSPVLAGAAPTKSDIMKFIGGIRRDGYSGCG